LEPAVGWSHLKAFRQNNSQLNDRGERSHGHAEPGPPAERANEHQETDRKDDYRGSAPE
jgi:hypothetical protein